MLTLGASLTIPGWAENMPYQARVVLLLRHTCVPRLCKTANLRQELFTVKTGEWPHTHCQEDGRVCHIVMVWQDKSVELWPGVVVAINNTILL